MSLLAGTDATDRSRKLEALSARAVRLLEEDVAAALRDRSVMVRWAAAEALGRAGVGARALINRLHVDKNKLVLAEICDSLASTSAKNALPSLRGLAKASRSSLVRGSAALAIADLGKAPERRFLERLMSRDRSPRVRAVIACALLALGDHSQLDRIRRLLRLRDAAVRCSIANLLSASSPRRVRREVVEMLREANKGESRRGVRLDLEHAIEKLEGEGK